ncbi:unnamed protein product [Cylicocyclus nassatus]|uniref:CRIB domain-containing protein n=1 Tax=Cylicocyclus nassatus TaxID=53992 RepID=A0AA36GV71_CYLNA|nr:unnamed protein product [Cylicocyclus nassatus]
MTNKEKRGETPYKKTTSPDKIRKTKKLDISAPYDFRHVDHVGFNSELSKTGIVADEVRKSKEVSSQPQASKTSPHPIPPVRRSRRLKKLDISKPSDFRHVDHIGFESSDVCKASPVAEEVSKLEEIVSHQKKYTTQNFGATSAPKHVRQGSSRNVAGERSKSSDANAGRISKSSSFKRSASARNGEEDVKHVIKQASCEEFPSVKATSVLFSKENTATGGGQSVSIPSSSKPMEESPNQRNKAPAPPIVRQISTENTGDSDGKVRKLQDIFIQRANSEKVRNSVQKAPLSPPVTPINEQQPQPFPVKLEASSKEHVVSVPSSSNFYESHTLPAPTEDEKLPPWMAELGKKERTRLIAAVLLAEREKVKDRNKEIGAAKNVKADVSQRVPKRQAPPPPSVTKVDKLNDNPRRDKGDISSTTMIRNNELVKQLNEKIDSIDASPPVPKPRRKLQKQQQQQGYVENIGMPTPLLDTPEMIKKRLLLSDTRQSESAHGPKEPNSNEKAKKKETGEQQAKQSNENHKCEENTDSDDDDATIRL